MDHSGIFLSDVGAVFYSLLSAETNADLQAIARELSPLLSAHDDNINLNEKLFARVKAVYDQRPNLTLTAEKRIFCWKTPTRASSAAARCWTRPKKNACASSTANSPCWV